MQQQRGSALVVTLAFVILLTVIAVQLIDTVRIDHASANSHLEGLQAEFYAQAAVARVIGTLQMQTAPQQTGSNTVQPWVSLPGGLGVGTSGSTAQLTPVDLSSGSASTAAFTGSAIDFAPPNLNVPTFYDASNHLITNHTDSDGNAIQMPVAWVYVRQSGSLVYDPVPITTNKSDPIVGRYAYWTDDESCKLNLNLAWARSASNTAAMGDPSRVDLTALQASCGNTAGSDVDFQQTWADTVHKYVAPPRFYNSLENARVASGTDQTMNGALKEYQFETTHYNADPDVNIFGEPRIVLTTQARNVPVTASGTAPFINILKTANKDPGVFDITNGNIDGAKVNATMAMLMKYLTRTDWPMTPGSSFQKKYFGSDPDNRIAQIALNIIEYVRCKESTEPIVDPIRLQYTSGSFVLANVATNNSYFLGISRVPLITEVGMYVSNTAIVSSGTTGWPVTMKMEVYLPPNYGLTQVDLTKFALGLQYFYNGHAIQTSSPGVVNSSEITGAPNGILASGSYAVITRTYDTSNMFIPIAYATARPAGTLNARPSLLAKSGSYSNQLATTDIAPLSNANAVCIPCKIDAATVPLDQITSCEVDDPRVNKGAADWVQHPGGSFGQRNSIYMKTTVSGTEPQQDLNGDGTVSEYSMFMPPPKGVTYNGYDNTKGLVQSVGELGYINTGLKCASAGVPWRSLRLQPNSDPAGTVPDWALLDLFTVPITATNAISRPYGNSVGGRVNVNATVAPFGYKRWLPLAGVFQGCVSGSGSSVLASGSAIAQHICNRDLAVTRSGTGKLYGYADGFYAPAEIVEVAGVADRGEESEELVRQVSNLLTARSNVYTVYSIGQSVKQTSSGRLIVTGEKRLQTTVERYTPSGQSSDIRFRTVGYRDLTP